MALSQTSENPQSTYQSIKEISFKIIRNPLIIGIVVGFIVALLKIQIPLFLNNIFNMLGNIGTPLGLIGIGGYFAFDQLKSFKVSIFAVVLKIIIFPTLITCFAYFLGLDYMSVSLIFVLFGAPTAISSFIMATALDGDGQLAANIVILSTGLSLFTMIVGISFIASVFV